MFKPGDKVQHITGGPVMGVVKIEGDDVHCSWMDKGKPQLGCFPAVVLKPWEPPRAYAPSVDFF